MFRKSYRDLSLISHMIACTLGVIAIGVIGIALPSAVLLPDETGQRNTWIMLSVVAGFLIGPAAGVALWAVNRGMHYLAEQWRAGKALFQQGQYEGRVEAAYGVHGDDAAFMRDLDAVMAQHRADSDTAVQGVASSVATLAPPAENIDPWMGTNPYGCCQDNYDTNGVLHHGDQGCRHPLIVG